MPAFRHAITQLSNLKVAGVRHNFDLDQIPVSIQAAQLPALLVIPIELESDRIFRERADSLHTAAFSGSAKTVTYRLAHLLLLAPKTTGLGLRSHLPRLIDLVDNYITQLAADVTLGDALLVPARVSVEPGFFAFDEREYVGCAFRHTWLLEAP